MPRNKRRGQPVVGGSGATIGQELFVNGDASSSTGLTLSGSSISAGRFTLGASGGYVECDAIASLVPGTYHCTVDDPNDSESPLSLTMGGGGNTNIASDLSGHWTCDNVISSTPGSNKLRITNGDSISVNCDNISIKRTA